MSRNPNKHNLLHSMSESDDYPKPVALPNAQMGEVVLRFKVKLIGYLHLGHVKAVLLNQYYRDNFNGKLIVRFDDIRQLLDKKEDFEKIMREDLELLQVNVDKYSRTSDYFDATLKYCEQLLQGGNAYVDGIDWEDPKGKRKSTTESRNRNNSVGKNMSMWEEMKAGTKYGQDCCVRAKIDMNSSNGYLRDPVIYRYKTAMHPASEYLVYPTYEFAGPIIDNLESVTHYLRTTKHRDVDDQYFWFINTLGMRKPNIFEYNHLNMTNTIMSRKKLLWFLEQAHVWGWDDPRFPTIRGMRRRGMTMEGLKEFIASQRSSKSVNVMQWEQMWLLNMKYIDPIAPRYFAVNMDNRITIDIHGAELKEIQVLKHPKNKSLGYRTIWTSPQVIVDYEDAKFMKPGENVNLINWGNIKVTKIMRNDNGSINKVTAELNTTDQHFKNIKKVTWLAAPSTDNVLIRSICTEFRHIIKKPVLGKDENFKWFARTNKDSRNEWDMLLEPEMKHLKRFDIVQVQHKGFFVCDFQYRPHSIYTGIESPVLLIKIPDGDNKK